jgi:predicted dinucleotide-binding enzyme
MKIGIIGSGPVAHTIANKLLQLGHEVMISARDVNVSKETHFGKFPSVATWAKEHTTKGIKAYGGSFAQAAKFGEIIFNCTTGAHSLDALTTIEEKSLKDKILVDVANPLDFSQGMPPSLTICNTESLGEKIQSKFPKAKVVKALNTVNAYVMVNPALLPGDHDLFIAGNDKKAKEWVKNTLLMKWFEWSNVIDLGDISSSRGTEMYLPLWARLWGALQNPMFNIHVVEGPKPADNK